MDGLRGDEASPVLLAIHISCRHRRCRFGWGLSFWRLFEMHTKRQHSKCTMDGPRGKEEELLRNIVNTLAD